jgi:hypothetical protein
VYSEDESWENLVPQYKYSGIQDYKTTLSDEKIKIFLKILLHKTNVPIVFVGMTLAEKKLSRYINIGYFIPRGIEKGIK